MEAKILKRNDWQAAPKIPDRLAQCRPRRIGQFEQAYFVFLDEDEIAVFICADTAFFCFFAQLIERPKSLPVTVQNSGLPSRAGEAGTVEVGFLSGERVLEWHDSAMRPKSGCPTRNAKDFCAQAVHNSSPRPVRKPPNRKKNRRL